MADRGKPAGRRFRLNLWQVLVAPLVVGLLLAALSPLVTGNGEEQPADGQPKPADRQPKPQSVGPLVVRNPFVESEPAGEGVRQSRASMPVVEVILKNTGASRSVLTSARFTIRGHGEFELCTIYYGAPLEVSARYDVVLPLQPKTGQTIEIPISQQLASDEADRIAFRFGNPELGPNTQGGFLYLLEITLVHERERRRLPVGKALISLPGTPSAAVVGPGEEADPECVRRNHTLLERLSAGRVARSTELSGLADKIR